MALIAVNIIVAVEGKQEPVTVGFEQAIEGSLDLDKVLQKFTIAGDVVVGELVKISGVARGTPA